MRHIRLFSLEKLEQEKTDWSDLPLIIEQRQVKAKEMIDSGYVPDIELVEGAANLGTDNLNLKLPILSKYLEGKITGSIRFAAVSEEGYKVLKSINENNPDVYFEAVYMNELYNYFFAGTGNRDVARYLEAKIAYQKIDNLIQKTREGELGSIYVLYQYAMKNLALGIINFSCENCKDTLHYSYERIYTKTRGDTTRRVIELSFNYDDYRP